MHVVVCIKMVPDTTQVKIDPSPTRSCVGRAVHHQSVSTTMRFEAALRVKDK